ncbi:hypothetical protein MMC31_000749, partial [Peltigera leucophlebia]|nr:hypothetical protein [Peltigera leucophlebia]
ALESPSNKQYHQKASLLRTSSPIAPSDGLEAAFLAACNEVEEDAEDFVTDLPDEPSEFIGNQAFIEEGFESDSEKSESDKGIVRSSNENFEESHFASNKKQAPGPASRRTGSQSIRNAWISDCSTENAKLKLIRILKGEALVPKQRWGIDKILATLVQHRKDPRLHTPYRQFKRFAYQTMFEESDKSNGKWPSSLKRNDWNIIIQLQTKAELEKRYNKEVQELCKTACFGTVDEQTPGVVHKSPLDDIIETATEKAPFISSMISS